MPLDAIVVLGCRVGPDGVLSGAASRRVERAAAAFHAEDAPLLIASGGKRWAGVAEATAFSARLTELGVPRERLWCELSSLSTRQNARFSCELLREHGAASVGVVTCQWHMRRALAAFRHYGISAQPLPAPAPLTRWRRLSEPLQLAFDSAWLRLERLGLLALCLGLVLCVACRNGADATAPAPPATSSAAQVKNTPEPTAKLTLAAVIESARSRRLDGTLKAAASDRDPTLRAAALRGIAQTDGPAAVDALLGALADEAPTVVALAAFGLGRSCNGHEAEFSRALTLRATALSTFAPPGSDSALAAIASALGRCASDEAERTLRAWLKVPGNIAECAAFALGEVAQRRGRLEEQTFVALLGAAAAGEGHVAAALAPFTRFVPPPSVLRDRLIDAAQAQLSLGGSAREFALRALGRAGATDALITEIQAHSPDSSSAGALARELARLGEGGQRGLGELLLRLVPADGSGLDGLVRGDGVGALVAVLDALETASPKTQEVLQRLARVEETKAAPPLERRRTLVRCGAARLLSKDPSAPELSRCDPDPAGRTGKLARVFVLDHGNIAGARAELFRTLIQDPDPVVREQALRCIPKHRELGNAAVLLGRALGDDSPGVVATAAEILAAHPERAEPGARSDGDASQSSTKGDAKLSAALGQALARLSPNEVTPRAALIDAVMALKALTLMSELDKSCADPNPTLRLHAERALTALGQPKRRCGAPSGSAPQPLELAHLVNAKVTISFDTDVGELELELEPSAAPLAVTRVVDLAKSGFYDGTLVHRALFGFAVQFGDPGGDGYGSGGHPPLFSELGPTPFEERSVGLAQSGLDTGSTQIFVALGRFPHLDGQSAHIGRAGPGWERLVIGDRIKRAKVRE